MSLFLDLKYANLLSSHLDRFSRKGEYLFNFRCPICLDSQKSKIKARGYIYKKKDGLFFKCHNCGLGLSIANLLKAVDKNLYDSYTFEKYKDGNTRTATESETITEYKPKKKFVDIGLPNVTKLPTSHFALKYLLDRKIPEEYLHLFYFAEDFQEWAFDITNGEYKEKYHSETTDSRIIIPFFDRKNELIAVQGRALYPSKLRYITLKFDEEATKIFGLERWNPLQKTYVLEGPFDSLFLPNAVAMAGSSVDISKVFEDKENTIFVYDNECRSPEIIRLMKKTINKDFSVCIWPSTNKLKDINDMFLSGRTKEDILQEIEDNTKHGLEALLALNSWKKC